jgi:hypothetical protein
MSFKARREAQLRLYKKVVHAADSPALAAIRAELETLWARVREKYSAEIARLTETIMEHLDDAAGNGRYGVTITVGFSREELDLQRLNPERVGLKRMWEVIIDDLQNSDYVVTGGHGGGVLFLDAREVPAYETILRGPPSHYYIKFQ